MEAFKVEGGHPLQGKINVQGAKNEALQIIAASLLTDKPVLINNLPDILDIKNQLLLLEILGAKVERIEPHTVKIQASNIDPERMKSLEFRKISQRIRGSVLLVGPMVARYGQAFLPRPGGDRIGRRRLDAHIESLRTLGVRVTYDRKENAFLFVADNMHPNFIFLPEPSVTGTANAIMAAATLNGHTTIYNAACEPYIQQLCRLLNKMGCKIDGIGSNRLEIEGNPTLSGTEHTILPDMIEVGSFIGLAALTGSDITIQNAGVEHLGQIPRTFEKLGIELNIQGDDIHIPAQEIYEIETYLDGSILTISDGPWPLFTPDLLSVVLVTAIQARGSVLIHQKMFESRLFFIDNLIDMGAQIILCDPHRATVIGMERRIPLRGIRMSSPDIRAGIALLIAALSAEGTSTIYNIEQIDRGYERIDDRLRSLGAHIERIPVYDK